MNDSIKAIQPYPYKSVAVALLFSAVLGPVGLLYASFWGGLVLILLAIVFISCKFGFLTIVLWLTSCVWGVGAVGAYNKKLMQEMAKQGAK